MKEVAKDKVKHADVDFSLERVPLTARKPFIAMFVIMLGFTFFSASMSVGAKMANEWRTIFKR